MELKSQDYLLFITEKLSFLLEALLEWATISVPLWMAVPVGLLLSWILGFVSKLGSVRSLLASQRGTHTEGEHVTRQRALAIPSHESNGIGKDGPAIQLEDLQKFYLTLHHKDGGPPWEFFMERSIPGMIYKAWRRDPKEGPTEYRSHHVFENATPQTVKDFFLDDEFRHKWDDLILSANCFEGCNETGESFTHWVKKFPFFCSNREYVICRRIYECRGTYFCITKAVTHSAVPVKKKPRRVDVYSSCWCIKAVESSQTGHATACEVTFVHSEDMLIQRDLAKIGVRRGIWPLVKKMEPGLRKYQAHRKSSSILSFSASMAQLVTSVPSSYLEESNTSTTVPPHTEGKEETVKQGRINGWKWVAIGGVAVLVCGFNNGALGRVVVLGVAKRLSRLGRRP